MSKQAHAVGAMHRELAHFKRERIVEAAADLFYEHGYPNTTLDAVADALGVRKPFIYTYFGSKADLLADICQRGLTKALAEITAIAATEANATDKLRAAGQALVTIVISHQKHNVIWAREEKNLLPEHAKKINAIRREYDRQLHSILAEGCASGEFDIADTGLATLAIGGIGTWTQVWYREKGRLDVRSIADGLTELMLTMVKAKTAGSPSRGVHGTASRYPVQRRHATKTRRMPRANRET